MLREHLSSIALASVITGCAMLGLLLIDDWQLNTLRRKHAEQIKQLEFASIAAEDIARPLEPFYSDLARSDPALVLDEATPFSAEKPSDSKLVSRLKRLDARNRTVENKLVAASRRLRLLEGQSRELDAYLWSRSHWMSVAMLGCIIVSVVFSKLAKRHPVGNDTTIGPNVLR